MFDLILYAIPFFTVTLFLEMASFYFLPDDDERGYELRDSTTSLAMGLGNVAVNAGWKLVVLFVYAAVYELSPLSLPADNPWTWVALFFADDFIYYWYHRTHHTIRIFWASHVVHHSSEHYNLSTALRQPVADALTASIPYGALALLGYRPEVIETARGVNLLYQFWIHTEAIRSIGPLEQVLNSPSLHRVHHGSNRRYLDRNHGSILIVWDRLFGTHQVEDEPVVYGLTRNIETFNPARIATHELADIVTDVAASTTWRDRLSFVLRGPGWAYARRAERAVPEPVVAAGVA